MDHTRLTKIIFLWDYNKDNNVWCKTILNICNSVDCIDVYNNMLQCDIKVTETKLIQHCIAKWKLTLAKLPKLRTYVLYKQAYVPETYLTMKMSRRRRSLMSQFRSGVLPLEIERGRYTPVYDKFSKKNRKRKPIERKCKLCNLDEIEDEYHFLCSCSAYSILRKHLFDDISLKCNTFITFSKKDQFSYIMEHHQLEVSRYINDAWSLRQSLL